TRVAFDQAAVEINGRLGDGQAQAAAFRTATDHRVENALADIGRDAGAVVDNIEAADDLVVILADGEVALDAGAQTDDSAAANDASRLEGLHGVAHHVECRLNKLFLVPGQFGNAGVIVAHDGQFALGFRL